MSALPASTIQSSRDSRTTVNEFRSNLLVIGMVGPIGAGVTTTAQALKTRLSNPEIAPDFKFDVQVIKASDCIREWAGDIGDDNMGSVERRMRFQALGNKMRSKDPAALAARLFLRIHEPIETAPRRAYILDSLKNPIEINFLRTIFGSSFFVVGVMCASERIVERLSAKFGEEERKRKGGKIVSRASIEELCERDVKPQDPKAKHSQRMADALELSDYFIDNSVEHQPRNSLGLIAGAELDRFCSIIRNEDIRRPTESESAMHAAYSAKHRSSCLSRQVGAALINSDGDIVATGTNEAPCSTGGVYREGRNCCVKNKFGRCFERGEGQCQSEKMRGEIINEAIAGLELPEGSSVDAIKTVLNDSGIKALTEFGRAVHAEMDAVLCAARLGVKTGGTRMYVTTFPCHTCARHIVAAGVWEVQYIEPYSKSKALELHSDAIVCGLDRPADRKQVLFRPFSGVAPRFYERAFALQAGIKDESGYYKIQEPEWGEKWNSLLNVDLPTLRDEIGRSLRGCQEEESRES